MFHQYLTNTYWYFLTNPYLSDCCTNAKLMLTYLTRTYIQPKQRAGIKIQKALNSTEILSPYKKATRYRIEKYHIKWILVFY